MPARWDIDKAVQHLQANASQHSKRKCATYVRLAIEAGGLTISQTGSDSAKDYGQRLVLAGFVAQIGAATPYQKADVAVIDGFSKSAGVGITMDHVVGHMAMYDGTKWISDFTQHGPSPYPGSDYRIAKPQVVIYRFPR
jgi:hypothetical protein